MGKYPQKMMSPHDSSKMTEADIKEYLMENYDLNEQEIQAEYEYIMSRTQTLENGLFEMVDECMIHMKSTYPDMENEGEMVDCEVDFVFRNFLDMSLTWNGHEMVGMDFRYTFYYMGYEASSMSPMTWYNKVMSDINEISKEGYMMYKEHEHYQNEIMNHIQFLGNWDYAAGKMKVIFNEIMQNMKSEKCGKTLKEHAADYGYYMAEDGEMAMLKQHDYKIQMMEYFEMYNISMWSYMKTKACEFATENFGWDMEKDDEMVMEYPEFVYVEKSKEEMNARIQATCEMMHDEWINKENEFCDMIVDSYVSGRDMIVNFADMAVNKIQDRTGAETMIDAEFDMIMAKREGEWLEEFNYMWESEMNKEEGEEGEEEAMEEIDFRSAY